MKKILLVVAVLMLAAPAWAVTVDIWAVQVGSTDEVEIWYETNGNLPRAFGLNITVTEGNIVDCVPFMEGECDDVTRGYGIFPGTIVIVDGNVTDYNTPVAPSEDPGAEGTGLDTSEIVVEMGSLYTGANTPDTSGLLCTITVSAGCTVSIAENETRGGVVMEDPEEVPDVSFIGCTVAIYCTVPDVVGMSEVDASAAIVAAGLSVGSVTCTASCTAADDFKVVIQAPVNGGNQVECGTAVNITICECYCGQPDYSEWEAVGKPICWCYPRQCHGDADGLAEGKFDTRVGSYDNAILKDAWFKKTAELTGCDACADFDHSEEGKFGTRIGSYDNAILKANWFKKTTEIPGDCQPGNRTP